ncbi:MAG: hypothetical protein ABW122_13065, partial [Ilumatobacteraceae bacterium]
MARARRPAIVAIVPVVAALTSVAACSSDRDAGPVVRPSSSSTSAPADTVEPSVPADDSTPDLSGSTTSGSITSGSTTSGSTTTTTISAATTAVGGAGVLRGTAVAGSAGGVEAGGPPYSQTDPFSEAVRLADGTCTGWADSRGGSTAGLAVGSPVAVLDTTTNAPLGMGSITASRWVDVSGGG